MKLQELKNQINHKKNFLCIGLDPDLEKIPKHLLEYDDPIFEFCKTIVDQTQDIAIAYKLNLAFFECFGTKGWKTLEKVKNILPNSCFTIADAKRGDIGNTSKMYAKCFFEYLDFDAVTVAPYMGEDSVTPFLEYDHKWVILLGLTSNSGSKDFELLDTTNGKVFEQVLIKASKWASPEKLMFVIGATQSEYIKLARQLVPDYFFLVPGIGAQGGSLTDTITFGANSNHGLLINNSRQIIYASSSEDFGVAAREQSLKMIEEMRSLINFNP